MIFSENRFPLFGIMLRRRSRPVAVVIVVVGIVGGGCVVIGIIIVVVIIVVVVVAVVLVISAVVHRKFEYLAQESRRQRRNRIDAQHRIARLADDFVSDANEAFLLSPQEQSDDRQLAEQIVRAIQRH